MNEMNPFDKLQDDVDNDIILRCKELDIIKIEIECECPLRYTLGDQEVDDIDHFTIVVKENPFEEEEDFWEYLIQQMDSSIYFKPWIQNWYISVSK